MLCLNLPSSARSDAWLPRYDRLKFLTFCKFRHQNIYVQFISKIMYEGGEL